MAVKVQFVSGGRSNLRNGFPMLRSSAGPLRPQAAGPAAPLSGRCFRSGSLSSRVPVVALSCSAVSELFRFRITENVTQQILTGETPTNEPVSEREALACQRGGGRSPAGWRSSESRWGRSRVPAELLRLTEIRREQLISSQPITGQTRHHVVTPCWVHGPGERRRNNNQNKTGLWKYLSGAFQCTS